jgi:signal transduction histidine kinase
VNGLRRNTDAVLDLANMSPAHNGSTRTLLAYLNALFGLPRSIWVPIVAMFFIAMGAFAFNEWSVRRVGSSAASMASLISAQMELIGLRARIVDVETSQRAYLITRDPRYLESTEKLLSLLPEGQAQLRSSVARDELLPKVENLIALSDRKIAELRTTALLVQNSARDNSALIVGVGEGRILMDAFRLESDDLLKTVGGRITRELADTAKSTQLFRVAFAALGLMLLLLLVVAVRLLVKDFWRQESARLVQSTERHRLELLVDERTAQLSDLTTHLQTASEQEKAQLARDLHDELGGVLTAAKMDLAWLQGRASAKEPEAQAKLAALATDLDEALDVKRRVVENLRPALLDHFGLATALQAHFEEICKKADITFVAEIADNLGQVPQEQAIALFRVGQESLTNVLKHAKARNVRLAVTKDSQNVRILIADDGVGIDAQRLGGVQSHGLMGMRHRINALNGRFTISGNEPHGTRVEVLVPCAARH